MDDCRDLSSLFYLLPTQKGYLVNWDHQKTVWDYVLGKQCFNIKPDSTTLIFTEPLFNFASIQEGLSEMFFEEYGFSRVLRTHAPDLSCYQVLCTSQVFLQLKFETLFRTGKSCLTNGAAWLLILASVSPTALLLSKASGCAALCVGWMSGASC